MSWENIINDASEKDLWVNQANVVEVLEQFPAEKLQEVNWILEPPEKESLLYVSTTISQFLL